MKKPKYFVAENVEGILTLGKGAVIQKILKDFKSIGYKVDYKLLNAADYGVPQLRKRLVVICNITGHIIPWPKIKFFKDPEDYDPSLLLKHCKEDTFNHLSFLKGQLESLEIWEQTHIKEVIDRLVLDLEIGFGKIGLPLRLALTSRVNSPSIDLVCEILGKEIALGRLENFLAKIQNLKTDQ